MKKIFQILLISLLILLINSCDSSTEPENDLTVKPIVKKTANNYDEASFNSTFPKMDILQKICEEYKDEYSEKLKTDLFEYSREQVLHFGEDQKNFTDCFDETDCRDINSISLPTYIEKAKFK